MIWNIIDHRKRKYRWGEINAVIEYTAHDNSCEDSDQINEDDSHIGTYYERRNVTVHDAIVWAEAAECEVTLYLYDKGDGI